MPETLVLDRREARCGFHLSLPDPNLVSEAIAALRGALDPFFSENRASAREIYALNMALEELLTNLAKYGLPPGRALDCAGEIVFRPAAVELRLDDNGQPFNPAAAPQPETGEAGLERPVGGLGLFLLLQTFANHSYRREAGRNLSCWLLAREEAAKSP